MGEQPPDPEILAVRCSACNTLYRVPIEEIPDTGRRVKCARCGHVWFHGIMTVQANSGAPHPADWGLYSVMGNEPLRGREMEAAPHQDLVMVEPSRGDGLTAMIWLIAILALLVVILGVHVFAPQISAAIPALAPSLLVYVEWVGAVLAWIAEAAGAVAGGLSEAFQSYGS